MPCPYLTEVTMVFCRAVPVRKLVPQDRITSSAQCSDECFAECPAFREAQEAAGQGARAFDEEMSHLRTDKKGAQS
jgi:hypothetical protein